MNIDINISTKIFNKVYIPYLEYYDKFLLIFYGGSSSGKSKFVAQRNIYNLLKGGRNYLILKKTAASSQQSTFAEYKKVIQEWNLEKYFKITENPLRILCKLNGYGMVFQGMDNPEKKKSITFSRGVLTDIHYEEATEENNIDAYRQLETRLRGKAYYKGKKIKKQIVLTFNPILETHWIKKKFFDVEDDNIEIVKTTYLDNRFLAKEDIQTIESWKTKDPRHYKVYGLGEWGTLGELIFHNWKVEDLTMIKDKLDHYSVGLDFGFSNDPSVLLLTAFHNNKIYILKEFYQKGMLNSDIAKVIKRDFSGYLIWADCAEPKSIYELQIYGCKVMPVKKGKDSVKYGIEWLKQWQIIIDPRCTHTIQEIQGYTYLKDKDGNVTNQPIPMNDHCMDSLRYATEKTMIYMRSVLGIKASDLGL